LTKRKNGQKPRTEADGREKAYLLETLGPEHHQHNSFNNDAQAGIREGSQPSGSKGKEGRLIKREGQGGKGKKGTISEHRGPSWRFETKFKKKGRGGTQSGFA